MSVISGFFNSINNDRLYNAIDMGRLFDGLIHDGVFATLGDHMMVTSRGGFRLAVGTGKAWFDHTWTIVDSVFGLTLEPADSILKRIDTVVLEVNNTDAVRRNMIKIVKGEESSNPVKPILIRDDQVNQYPLAYINVQNGISGITQSDITNAIGTSECPFVTAVNQSVTVDELLQQWEYQFNNFVEDSAKEFRDWQIAEKQAFDDWERRIQTAFEQWQDDKNHDFDDWWDRVIDVLETISVGEFAVKFVQMQDDVKEINRHLDTFEEYAQTYYQTVDYEPHITKLPSGGTYGDFNDNEWLIPGIYVLNDAEALIDTNHAPTNAKIAGVMRVYDTSGSNIKTLIESIYMEGLPTNIVPFNIIQEFEYCGGCIPKIRRFITQTTSQRTYSKWMFADEQICIRNVSVPSNGWVSSGIQKMPYKSVIAVPGIDSNWYADVYFDSDTILSNKMASFTTTTTNGVEIYAKQAMAITVPLVVCKQGSYLGTEVIK